MYIFEDSVWASLCNFNSTILRPGILNSESVFEKKSTDLRISSKEYSMCILNYGFSDPLGVIDDVSFGVISTTI